MNRNKSLKWLHEDAQQKYISIDKEIENVTNPIRGIYGIFVKGENEKCVYVGRAISIYDRMFGSNGHITKLKDKRHTNSQLMDAVQSGKKVEIKILEKIPYEFDNYYKDMQRLASAENKYIDFYQNQNQCLEQVPEGTKISKKEWEDKAFQLNKSNHTVVVPICVKPQCIEEFIDIVTQNVECSRKENGVISFDVMQNKEKDSEFLLVEVYKTPEDQLNHRETEHFQVFKEQVQDLIQEPYQASLFNIL